MKIAAIANPASKTAIQSMTWAPSLEWVWVDSVEGLAAHRDTILYADFEFRPDKNRIQQLASLLPHPILIHSVSDTIARIGHPFIRINAWPGMLERRPVELAVGNPASGAAVMNLFKQLDWPCRIVPDIPGLIGGRILASIINEAFYTLQDQVSTRGEIDEAMRLGTGYPLGPFAWGQKIGMDQILSLLEAMSKSDPRYQPARMLEQEVGRIKI